MNKKILFITPYRHLKRFLKKIKELGFQDIDGTSIKNEKNLKKYIDDNNIKFVFSAPNYQKYILNQDYLGNDILIITPSTGTNHLNFDNSNILSIKNDKVLKEIYSTAEHNLFLLLSLAKKSNPPIELSDKTLSILGYGRLGKMIKNITKPIFKNVYVKDKLYQDDYFFSADFLSINVDLNESTYNLVNKEFVKNFKKKIFIVNTSRGEIVNEDDIIFLLNNNLIYGYATDVVTNEHVLNKKSKLFKLKKENLIITNHTAGTSIFAQEKAYIRVLQILNKKIKKND